MALAGLLSCPSDSRAVPRATGHQSPFSTARTARARLGQPGTQGALVPTLGPSGGGSAGDGDRSWAGDTGACRGHPGGVCLHCASSPGAGLCHTDHGRPLCHLAILCHGVPATGCPCHGEMPGLGQERSTALVSPYFLKTLTRHDTAPCPAGTATETSTKSNRLSLCFLPPSPLPRESRKVAPCSSSPPSPVLMVPSSH